MKLPVVEIFNSIQGEGHKAGSPVVFVRSFGCNRRCIFCDEPKHLKVELKKEYSVVELFESLKKDYNLKTDTRIVFTGGEPLVYNEFFTEFVEFIYEQEDNDDMYDWQEGLTVSFETNGSIKPDEKLIDYCHFTVSPKQNEILDALFTKFKHCDYELKFVLGEKFSPFTFEQILEVKDYKVQTFIQPIEIDGILSKITKDNYRYVINLIKSVNSDNIRLSCQTHKILSVLLNDTIR